MSLRLLCDRISNILEGIPSWKTAPDFKCWYPCGICIDLSVGYEIRKSLAAAVRSHVDRSYRVYLARFGVFTC